MATTGGLTTFCVVVTYHVLQSVLTSQREAGIGAGMGDGNRPTLSFDVCDGMANQRLSLLYGIVLAFELGRAAVLPNFQVTVPSMVEDSGRAGTAEIAMSEFYDVPHFIQRMAAVGVEVVARQDWSKQEGDLAAAVDISSMDDPVEKLTAQHKNTQHLHVGCPLHRLQPFYFSGANNRIMWSVLEGLQPNKRIVKEAAAVRKHLNKLTYHRKYNILHLRIENDWEEYCSKWQATAAGKLHNNCMNNTDTIDQVLMNLNVPVTEPLYVVSNWAELNPNRAEQVLSKLTAAGFQVVTSRDVARQFGRGREHDALVNYEVSLTAHKFLGNSASTWSALALLQRRHNALWSSYYNGGTIPLADHLPVDQLPWVFTFSNSTPHWDYLVKAAVRSAARHKSIRPYCLWSGNTSAFIYGWMREQGVSMIEHVPDWANELWKKAEMYKEENAKVSPIFKTQEALTENFIRIDVPVIPELEQYVYILFTDPDVYFHKKVTLATFSMPLPAKFAMAADPDSSAGLDGGVMLMNAPAMRESYEEFRAFVLSNRRGGFFPSYGAGVTGAYAAFYESYIKRGGHMSAHLAAKPFSEYDPAADIVHFLGPKPHEYLHFFKTLQCEHGQMCEKGLRNSLCQYAKRWHVYLNETEDEVGLATWYACLVLYAPHLKGLAVRQKFVI